jgi:hypothetical protein
MGQVIFRCPKTAIEFGSGFEANETDVKLLPAEAKIRLRCRSCGDIHEFKFSDARIAENVSRTLESQR